MKVQRSQQNTAEGTRVLYPTGLWTMRWATWRARIQRGLRKHNSEKKIKNLKKAKKKKKNTKSLLDVWLHKLPITKQSFFLGVTSQHTITVVKIFTVSRIYSILAVSLYLKVLKNGPLRDRGCGVFVFLVSWLRNMLWFLTRKWLLKYADVCSLNIKQTHMLSLSSIR